MDTKETNKKNGKKQANFLSFYSPFRFFIVFSLLSILLTFLLDEFVVTDEVFYQSYAERYTFERIQELAELISTVKWILYFLTPILYFLKFFMIAIVLSIGDFLYELKIGFNKLFQLAMIAELVFLLPDMVKLIWFLVFEQAETIKHVGSFELLSIYSLFKNEEIYSWLRYPFSTANIFELIYWLVLALGIKYLTNLDYNKSLKFILSTYVPTLIVWVVFVMFLSIMQS